MRVCVERYGTVGVRTVPRGFRNRCSGWSAVSASGGKGRSVTDAGFPVLSSGGWAVSEGFRLFSVPTLSGDQTQESSGVRNSDSPEFLQVFQLASRTTRIIVVCGFSFPGPLLP